uniref:Ubiquitin-like domain-containing protein n=1 Tax=Caenorhabditis tropicalis TaxID=1561998 RepID=A0A1I7UBK2_9PELO
MTVITIRLVGGNDDRLFNIEVDNKILYIDLMKKIQYVTHIPIEFQELQLRGEVLPVVERPIQDIKFGEEICVTHSMIGNWREFIANFELARQALASKQVSQVEESVDQALKHLMPLMTANFLIVFPQFGEHYRQFKTNFARYMDQEFKYIELAVRDYFSKVLGDNAECPTLDIRCDKKGPEEGGIQGGLICHIWRNKTIVGKYYVKEHMGLSNWQSADIREIFVYKLLELIGCGPNVHFIPNTHYSSFGLYIGTEEVPGFQRADTEGMEISCEIYAQRDLLRRILSIRDLHSKNFGIDAYGKLSIVDLQVKNNVDAHMVHKYLDGYQGWKGSKELRIQVAKDYITSWDLLNNFDKANAAICMQKDLFKKHSISYKPSRNFEEYFLLIKNNLHVLIECLK